MNAAEVTNLRALLGRALSRRYADGLRRLYLQSRALSLLIDTLEKEIAEGSPFAGTDLQTVWTMFDETQDEIATIATKHAALNTTTTKE